MIATAAARAEPTTVIIIGGGAGGLELAIRLAHRSRSTLRAGRRPIEVTLVDCQPSHLWKPRLHEIAAGLLRSADEAVSFAELAAQHGFSFVLGAMSGLNPVDRTVSLGPVRTLRYDIAVLATGSSIDDHGIRGVSQYCYTLDAAADAQQLHLAMLAMAARVKAKEASHVRVAIVGAGTTGVELAAELQHAVRSLPAFRSLMRPEQLSLLLLEMTDRLLPLTGIEASDRVRHAFDSSGIEMRFNAQVERVQPGLVQLADGSAVRADLIVWTSGVRGREVARTIENLQMEKGDRVRVDRDLRAAFIAGKPASGTLYCIGDCAAFFEQGAKAPLGATAQVAQQQARALARSLVAQIDGGSPRPFRFRDRGTLVSLGATMAVGNIPFPGSSRSLSIAGPAAKAAYAALYRVHLITLYGWWRGVLIGLSGVLRRSALPAAKLPW